MPLFGRKEEVDEDPQRVIEHFTSHIPVPKWQPKSAYKQCHHCNDNFVSGHQHNCRLCGHMFCSKCTAKHHVPPRYKLKKKTGNVRVCFGCRDSCFAAKLAAEKAKAFEDDPVFAQNQEINVTDASGINYDKKLNMIYPPEEWEPEAKFTGCNKCHKSNEGKHNCRVCGKLYCSKCSGKLNLPIVFEKKQGKTNTSMRACDGCKYFVTSSEAKFSTAARSKTANVTKSIGLSKAKAAAASNLPKGTLTLDVMWEGKKTALCTVTVDANDSLLDIHEQVSAAVPTLGLFHYICRGTGVNKAFWDIFKAKYMAPAIYLRAGTVSAPIVQMVGGAPAADGAPVEAVSTDNNPYAKSNQVVKKEVKKVEAPPKPAVEEIKYKFARPNAKAKLVYVAPVVEQKVSESAAEAVEKKEAQERKEASSGGDLNAKLAFRAKEVFGQLS